MEQHETVAFRESAVVDTSVETGIDASMLKDLDSYSNHLGQFLARPVRIWNYDWTTASTKVVSRLDVWSLWQDNAAVKEKMKHFAFFSGNLKVRIMMNSSPFHYGKMMIGYVPYAADTAPSSYTGNACRYPDPVAVGNLTECGVAHQNSLSSDATVHYQYLRHLSGYQHQFLYAGENNVVEMTLPFIWHRNALEVRSSNYESPGRLIFAVQNPLRKATAGTNNGSVEVQVFAWIDDIKLEIPTDVYPTSGKGKMKKMGKTPRKDEYPKASSGVVSTTASAIARAAGQLVTVPVIGPFARATEIAGDAASNIARIFGFSNPRNLDAVHRNKLKTTSPLSTYSGTDSAQTLAWDPKQEVPVDPRVVGGSGVDELDIKYIVTKEQYLTTTEWLGDQGPKSDRRLFTTLVTPNLPVESSWTNPVNNVVRTARMETPAGYLGEMFGFWHGGMIFRFEAVASKYHSGRLLIQYRPFCNSATTLNAWTAPAEENVVVSAILDLAETNCVEIEIPYTTAEPYLTTRLHPPNAIAYKGEEHYWPHYPLESTHAFLYDYSQTAMGVLQVFILNDLVAPLDTDGVYSDTTAPIQVNVYVRCAEDFGFAMGGGNQANAEGNAEFQEPWQYAQVVPTSGEACEVMELFSTTPVDPKDDLIFFGESVVNLRQLMKRYVLNCVDKHDKTSGTNTYVNSFRHPMHGFTHHVSMNSTGNFVTDNSSRILNTYLSFIRPMYLTLRGGYRAKFQLLDWETTNPEFSSTYLGVSRFSVPQSLVYPMTVATVDTNNRGSVRNAIVKGQYGTELTLYSYSPVIEVEIPWYSSRRFHLACNPIADQSYDTAFGFLEFSGGTLYRLMKNFTDISTQGFDVNIVQRENWKYSVATWGAASEDTSLVHLQGVPAIYTYTNPV